jgi:hypothetical protein
LTSFSGREKIFLGGNRHKTQAVTTPESAKMPGKSTNLLLPRDGQHTRALKALGRFLGQQKIFATADEVQVYLDRHTRSKWFDARFHAIAELGMVAKPIQIGGNPENFEKNVLWRKKFKTAMFPIVFLPYGIIEGGWSELMICHLVAHHCAKTDKHDRGWAQNFLWLVRKFMGKNAHGQMKQLFREEKVHFTSKRKLTEEQRAKMRERFMQRFPLALPKGETK